MDKERINKIKEKLELIKLTAVLELLTLFSFIFTSGHLEAICLKDCETTTPRRAISLYGTSGQNSSSEMEYADQNSNMGDVKNTVFGDMNISIGHESVEISTESNSNQNTIDASINSTIILGDMNK